MSHNTYTTVGSIKHMSHIFLRCAECDKRLPWGWKCGRHGKRVTVQLGRSCPKCGRCKTGRERKFCSPKCATKASHRAKPEASSTRALRGRRKRLKNLYNITPEDYEDMFQRAGGTCEACGDPPQHQRLSVDHDHKTGMVRGLLCSRCNTAYGYLREDVWRIQGLLKYHAKVETQESSGFHS